MQTEYLALLSESVKEFVLEVEDAAGIQIQVIQDARLNSGGPTGGGNLEVVINAQRVKIFAPTNGYFPDGAVRHEVLHVKRFHLDGVPKLALPDEVDWDKPFSDALGAMDNAIEHIDIVPIELELHPERMQHWEAVMTNVCTNLHTIPIAERRLAVCLHWSFMTHVLPESPSFGLLKSYASEYGLLEIAMNFSRKFLALNKEEKAGMLFAEFADILPKHRAALEYISRATGTNQYPIP
jgi:hypothetical protein